MSSRLCQLPANIHKGRSSR